MSQGRLEAARAVSERATRAAARGQRVHRGVIVSKTPLKIDLLHDGGVLEEDEDFDFSGWASFYEAEFEIKKGDTAWLVREGGEWTLLDILAAEKDIDLKKSKTRNEDREGGIPSHTHPIADITGLTAALANKSDVGHTHVKADITDFAHTHPQSDITSLTSDLAAKAPLASPALTGTPTAPTAAPGTNTTQVATTAFVAAAVGALSYQPLDADLTSIAALTTTSYGRDFLTLANAGAARTYLALGTMATETASNYAPLASPALTGTPTAPTGTTGVSSTQVATQAFVMSSAAGLITFALSGYATLASPAFTGNPTAPTPSVDDNDTSVATTAYVIGQASASGDGTPAMDGTAARGTSIHWARADHVHPTDTSRAPLASPTFTGTPVAPTATGGTNTTQIATTAFVAAAISGYQPVDATLTALAAYNTNGLLVQTAADTFTGRALQGTTSRISVANGNGVSGAPTIDIDTGYIGQTSIVTLGTVTTGTWQGTAISATYIDSAIARLASPTFTGNPAAPTAAVDTNTTQIATTAFVLAQASAVADGTPAMDGTAARGTATHWARADHVHPTDTSRAPLASPAFTGNPTAPTPTAGDNDTSIATTAFVMNAIAGSPQTYTASNVTTDRTYNANATSIDELADVLGTLIADLRTRGIVA